jgi:ABC-type polysaccharide/polyol phosphate transport system ATPase subunit
MSIIKVKHLTKEYQLGHLTSFKETALNSLRRLTFQPIHEQERFKALDDVNFTIEEGEVVGIIGHNGAGKSTLLKHLANISKPTKGKVIVRGSVAPLIEVGAGVNPELTGRENIFLNGAILGIPKKIIKQKLDEIIDFSELEQFIDTPVKRYSSGMTVKLGFSIATSMDAEILIIDEVLAVGDLAFQRKCFDRMESLIKNEGKTVLLVSHNIRQIERICSRVILLNRGKVFADGNAEETCNLFYEKITEQISENKEHLTLTKNVVSTKDVTNVKLSLYDEFNKQSKIFTAHKKIKITLSFESFVEINNAIINIGFHTNDFVYIATFSSATQSVYFKIKKGSNIIYCEISDLPLNQGTFNCRASIIGNNNCLLWQGENIYPFNVIFPNEISRSSLSTESLIDIPVTWIRSHEN